MSQDWNVGGISPENQGQMPTWQPGSMQQSPGLVASVPARWPLAVLTVLCFWPLGIAACVSAARVKSALAVGDIQGALNASKRVMIFFFISLGWTVLWLLILVSAAGGGGQ